MSTDGGCFLDIKLQTVRIKECLNAFPTLLLAPLVNLNLSRVLGFVDTYFDLYDNILARVYDYELLLCPFSS